MRNGVSIVTLSLAEVRSAAYAGVDRHVRAYARGRVRKFQQDDNWGDDILGAMGECAAAKALDVYWPAGAPEPDWNGDVGTYHVRTVDRPGKRLILHPDDPDDGRHVLVVLRRVTRTVAELEVPGWCFGRDGKHDRYWETHTGRPAFFVPTDQLRPISTLVAS